jgi:hypothetical protein
LHRLVCRLPPVEVGAVVLDGLAEAVDLGQLRLELCELPVDLRDRLGAGDPMMLAVSARPWLPRVPERVCPAWVTR